MTPEQQKEFINGRLKFHELQALWWMNSATNGHATIRHIMTGDHKLNADELRDEAMQTSNRHIHMYMEIVDKQAESDG